MRCSDSPVASAMSLSVQPSTRNCRMACRLIVATRACASRSRWLTSGASRMACSGLWRARRPSGPVRALEIESGMESTEAHPRRVGSSTQVRLLSRWLRDEGHDPATTSVLRTRRRGREHDVHRYACPTSTTLVGLLVSHRTTPTEPTPTCGTGRNRNTGSSSRPTDHRCPQRGTR